MSGTAFLFAGQGSQRVGMDEAIRDADGGRNDLLELADAALGFELSTLMRDGPAELLDLTEHAQPALLLLGVAQARALALDGLVPDAAAGHSLGQYAALVAAGALALDVALRLVHERGRLMQQTVPLGAGRMLAVAGLDQDDVLAVCDAVKHRGIIDIACRNAPGQIVISGTAAAVGAAEALLEEEGAGLISLTVSVPFHCRLLEPMLQSWEAKLREIPISAPRLSVIDNVTARPLRDAEDVRKSLLRQVTACVLFEESIAFLANSGIAAFVQLGPGRSLLNFARRVAPDVRGSTFDETRSLQTTPAG